MRLQSAAVSKRTREPRASPTERDSHAPRSGTTSAGVFPSRAAAIQKSGGAVGSAPLSRRLRQPQRGRPRSRPCRGSSSSKPSNHDRVVPCELNRALYCAQSGRPFVPHRGNTQAFRQPRSFYRPGHPPFRRSSSSRWRTVQWGWRRRTSRLCRVGEPEAYRARALLGFRSRTRQFDPLRQGARDHLPRGNAGRETKLDRRQDHRRRYDTQSCRHSCPYGVGFRHPQLVCPDRIILRPYVSKHAFCNYYYVVHFLMILGCLWGAGRLTASDQDIGA